MTSTEDALPPPPPKDQYFPGGFAFPSTSNTSGSVSPPLPHSAPRISSPPVPIEKPIGTLVAVVLKARHLVTASSSRWTKQSPYVSLTLYTDYSSSDHDDHETDDVASINSPTSTSIGTTRLRKKSSATAINNKDKDRKRKDSLASIPPTERALVIERRRTKSIEAEKVRLKASSVPNLLPPPEDDVLSVMTVLSGSPPSSPSPLSPVSPSSPLSPTAGSMACTSVTSLPATLNGQGSSPYHITDADVDVDIEPEYDPTTSLSTPPDKRGGQHPVWDSELRFPITANDTRDTSGARAPGPGRRMLNVEAWAQVGLGRKDRPLGSAQIEVERAIQGGVKDGKTSCPSSSWIHMSSERILTGSDQLALRMDPTDTQRPTTRRSLPQPHFLPHPRCGSRIPVLSSTTALRTSSLRCPRSTRTETRGAQRTQLAPVAARYPAPDSELEHQFQVLGAEAEGCAGMGTAW
jgi:hypothetical protein